MFDIENIIAYKRNILQISYVFKNIYKQIYMYKTIKYKAFKDHWMFMLIEIYYKQKMCIYIVYIFFVHVINYIEIQVRLSAEVIFFAINLFTVF